MWGELDDDPETFTVSPAGLYWERLDKTGSIAGLLAGGGDTTGTRSNLA